MLPNPMNVLFAHYGDFATNSTSHIAGFANALVGAGHACAVAVPWGADTMRCVPEVRFVATTHHECLQNPSLFPDGGAADVVHAWTPREVVRTFVLNYSSRTGSRLIVHLEDNEDYLFAAASGLTIDTLLHVDESTLRPHLTESLAHPRRARLLLHAADGITTILPTLRAFAPPAVPVLDLAPGVDFAMFRPLPAMEHQRAALGLRPGDKCIVYTGSTSVANADETRDLYEAVALLNQRGVPTTLIRTGADHPSFTASLPASLRDHVRHLGFVPRTELPQLLAQADVLVQPGRPGAFNNYRLPSKLPEYLAAGRPVILPASNLGLELIDGEEALVLGEATPQNIADACMRIFADASLATRLAANGASFARRRFDGSTGATRLLDFYQTRLREPARSRSLSAAVRPGESEISLTMRRIAAHLSATGDNPAREWLDLIQPLVQHMDQPQARPDELARLEHDRDAWRAHFEDARRHAANLEQRNGELVQDLDGLKLAHAIEFHQLRQTIAQREDKIARMTASYSWRLTAPLRAMGRVLRGTDVPAVDKSADLEAKAQNT